LCGQEFVENCAILTGGVVAVVVVVVRQVEPNN
jgi:hypothetical protein